MTEYLVMRKGNGDAWVDVDRTEAANARVAVRNAMKEYKLSEGTFRALPARSAKTYEVKTETSTRTVWA